MLSVKFAALIAVCTFGLAVTSHATVIAYDGFEDYAPGSGLIGQNLGTGWSGPWQSNALSTSTIDVTARSLIGGGSNAVMLQNIHGGTEQAPINNAGQAILRSFPQQVGTTYFSFRVRAENLVGDEFIFFYAGHSLYDAPAGDRAEVMGAGLRNAVGNPFFARIGQSASGDTQFTTINASPAPADTAAAFQVVMKISKSQSQFYDTVDLWVFDPETPVPATEPLSTSATAFKANNLNSLNQVALRVLNLPGNGLEDETLFLDEIRVSSEWNTVIPEPVGLGTFGIAAGALLGRRRRSLNP